MPWTVTNPPACAQHWTPDQKQRCVEAANAALARGASEADAIHACIAAGKSTVIDHCILDSVDLPGGGRRVSARIGRTGVQEYRRADGGTVRAWRPEAEVLAADFTGAAVTIGHPATLVTPETWRNVAVGHVAAQSRELTRIEQHRYVSATLQLNSREALVGVAAGRLVECSSAYGVRIEAQAGVTDSGEEYDVIFRDLKPNHVALLEKGLARAGRYANLADSTTSGFWNADMLIDASFVTDSTAPVPAVPAPAVPAPAVPAPSPAPQSAMLADAAAWLLSENQRLQASLAAADSTITQLRAQVETLPKAIADGIAAAQAETQFRAGLPLPKDFVADGKSKAELLRAAILHLDPQAKVSDSADENYLGAYLDALKKYRKPADFNKVSDAAPTKVNPASHISALSDKLYQGA